MTDSSPSTRFNNFDLVRLFAALQVAVVHAIYHLQAPALDPLHSMLNYLPGVPIFFVISGFLISLSWSRTPFLRQYILNRVLRIYPALWVCLLFTIAIIIGCGVRPDSASGFAAWLTAQFTFVQFYNPDFLRGFGVGVINGSLWTIPVELQFYVVLPLLAIPTKRIKSAWLMYAVAAAILTMALRPYILGRETMTDKLLSVSILPYLFYFLVGVILRLLYNSFPQLFDGKFLSWAGIYLIWVVIATLTRLSRVSGNQLSVLSIVLLGGLIVSAAFSRRELASHLLRDNDISYGIYIYHMPIINLLFFQQKTGYAGFAMALLGTLIMAGLSWRFIEKPALRLKKYSLHFR